MLRPPALLPAPPFPAPAGWLGVCGEGTEGPGRGGVGLLTRGCRDGAQINSPPVSSRANLETDQTLSSMPEWNQTHQA